MLRTIAILGASLLAAGCGDPGGAREVPVLNSRQEPQTAPPSNPNALTREARAIATH